MADFWQQGAITVLQRLKYRPIEELEKEIEATVTSSTTTARCWPG